MTRLFEYLKSVGEALGSGKGWAGLSIGLIWSAVKLSKDKLDPRVESAVTAYLGQDYATKVSWTAFGLIAVIVMFVLWEKRDTLLKPLALVWGSEREPQFERVDLRSTARAIELNKRIVRQLFEGATMSQAEAIKAQDVNNLRLMGLCDRGLHRLVGYGAIWPIRDSAATDLLTGRRNDNELTAEDVLPTEANFTCNYAIVVGMGVPGSRNDGYRVHARHALLFHFAGFIEDHYLARRKGELCLLAVGFSEPGKRLCKQAMKMKREGDVDYGKLGQFPLYSKRLRAGMMRRRVHNLDVG